MSQGIQKRVIKDGDGQKKPKAGEIVTLNYTLWLHDPNQQANNYQGLL
jgi:FKBP-type peptidyl-prolyl cis-trans isomerase